jgi:16S rRNA (guanine966-N2)-methyltransferase
MKNQQPRNEGELRIIGGQWRSRKLRFPALPGLRPTPDRIRETLFNWLAPVMDGARCLDLFAGSGALGLEALSRGAASCCFVDMARPAVETIRQHLQLLKAEPQMVVQAAAEQWLQTQSSTGSGFHIVFLDPPFGAGLLPAALEALARPGMLADNAFVYIETGRHESLPALPPQWQIHREKSAGQVCYRLLHVTAKTTATLP